MRFSQGYILESVYGTSDMLDSAGMSMTSMLTWFQVAMFGRCTGQYVGQYIPGGVMKHHLDYLASRDKTVQQLPENIEAEYAEINGDDKDDEDSDDSDSPTVEEFLAVLLQIQRAAEMAQEKARLEALARSGWRSKEQAKREAVARLYLGSTTEARRWRCFGRDSAWIGALRPSNSLAIAATVGTQFHLTGRPGSRNQVLTGQGFCKCRDGILRKDMPFARRRQQTDS